MDRFFLKLTVLAAIAAMLVPVSCTKENENNSASEVELKLDRNSVEITAGRSATVIITSGNGGYSVSIANPQIATATVSDSKITVSGKAEGETEATVTDKASKKATISIKVTASKETVELTLETEELTVQKGTRNTVSITSGNGGYTVSSDNESVATAVVEDSGVIVSGVEEGNAVITVTDAAGKSAEINVTVNAAIDKTPYGINMGEGHGGGDVGSHIILRCPIVRTYSADYDFTKMSAATIECLVKINENPVPWMDNNTSNWMNSIMGNPDYFWLRVNHPTLGDGSYPTNFKFNAIVEGVELNSQPMTYGTWHHVALTFKNGDINLYVDGELAETGAAGFGLLDLTKANVPTKWEDHDAGIYNKYYDFFLGCWNQSRWLNGCMAEARLWSVARSADQLSANATFLDVDDEEAAYGLLGYWKLRGEYDAVVGDMSEILKDYSPNHFDLEELSGNSPTATMVTVDYGK